MSSIRLWRIVPQTIKVRGVEIEVTVKQICHFPYIDAETKELKFGRLKSAPWQILIQRAGWPEDAIWKIRYNDSNGFFAIIYGEKMDPVRPGERGWEPGKTRKVVSQDERLSTDQVEAILKNRIKTTDGRTEMPDIEFIEMILGELVLAAEEVRQVA